MIASLVGPADSGQPEWPFNPTGTKSDKNFPTNFSFSSYYSIYSQNIKIPIKLTLQPFPTSISLDNLDLSPLRAFNQF